MFSRGSKTSNARGIRSAKERTPSIISNGLRVTGSIVTDGDVHVDGIIDGDVTSQSLTVGEAAVVNGSVVCDAVRVAGKINGEISSRVVELTRTARVIGDINHESLAIEAGAYVQGICRHVEARQNKDEPGAPLNADLVVAGSTSGFVPAAVRSGDTAPETYMVADRRTDSAVG